MTVSATEKAINYIVWKHNKNSPKEMICCDKLLKLQKLNPELLDTEWTFERLITPCLTSTDLLVGVFPQPLFASQLFSVYVPFSLSAGKIY